MAGRPLMLLALAMLFGLGAMLLSRKMLSKGGESQNVETQEVLVASRDIKEEESLKPDMVVVARMAKAAIPAGAFSSLPDIEGRWVRTRLIEGDPIVEKKLGPKGTPPGLVANIPKGMRAFALDVTEQSGVSGFILPGHHVDVVRYESEQGVQRAETILQNILVLASGQTFTRADEKSLVTRTVTVAVTPDQVDSLVAARAKGSLALSLRGVNDHDLVPRPKTKVGEDPMEKRLKVEEERRKTLEQEIESMKAAIVKKSAEPPPTETRQIPRFVTVYRGIGQVHRVRLDEANVSQLEPEIEDELKNEVRDRRIPLAMPPPGPQSAPNNASDSP